MNQTHNALARFNRKERYLLVEWALGATDFPLGDVFRASVEGACGLAIPERAFVATDYHLDWVYAALWAAYRGINLGEVLSVPSSPTPHTTPGKPR